MSVMIGKIAQVDGKFFAKAADGSLRELFDGDAIYEGETIVGDNSNASIDNIIVTMDDGSDIIVLGNEQQLFDVSVSQTEAFSEPETVSQSSAISDLVEEYADDMDIDDIDTAAGEDGGAASSEGGEAVFDVKAENITDVTAGLRKRAFENNGERNQEAKDDEDVLVDPQLARLAQDTEESTTEDTVAEDTTGPTAEDTSPEDTAPPSSEDTSPEETVYKVEEDTTDGVVNTPASQEDTTDESTVDATAEVTTVEDTTDATAESTVDEQTTDAVTEETSDVVNADAEAEQTTDEDTTDAVSEDTTDEDTTDAVAEDTDAEDTVDAQAEETTDEQLLTQ